MPKISERVTRMMENFISEWQAGRNISEIAQKYRVTSRTIYAKLQEIADKNGIQREELLEKPHKAHKKRGYCKKAETEKFSVEEIQKKVGELIDQTKLVIRDIDRVLKK